MGIIVKQSLISTILTYVGVLIGYFNLLYLFPQYLSLEEIGLQRTIQDMAMLLVPFVQLGVSQLLIRYFPLFKAKSYYSELISLIFIFFLTACIIFSSVFYVFKENISDYFSTNSGLVNTYLGYIFGLAILMALHQVLVAISQSLRNIILPNFLKEVMLRALTLVNIMLFAFQVISFHQFILILISAYTFNFFVLLIYLLLKKAITITFRFEHLKWNEIQGMLAYALFTFLGASGILIIGKVDSIMVASMLGLDALGIYSTAFYIAVLIELPKRAIAQIGMSIIATAYKNNNVSEIKAIYKKSSINNLIIGSLLFIGIWINLDNIFSIMPNSELFKVGKWIVLIIGAGKLIDMIAGLNGEIIVMSKHYRINVYLVVLLTLFTILANYLLIPIYGLEGAAIGSSLALLFFNLSKFGFLYWKESIQPFSLKTLVVILIASLTLLTGLYLPVFDNPYVDILYRSIIATFLFGSLILWLKPSEDIQNLITGFIKKFKNY
jgi:O-antigen/teichoic acid export membrane protein